MTKTRTMRMMMTRTRDSLEGRDACASFCFERKNTKVPHRTLVARLVCPNNSTKKEWMAEHADAYSQYHMPRRKEQMH
jgi:hypothetical protein